MTRLSVPLLVIALMLSARIDALEISHVYHDKELFDLAKSKAVKVHFRLSEAADVTLKLYDDKEYVVRAIKNNGLAKGDHYIKWDGRDQYGNIVPPEVYHYVIIAKTQNEVTEHDLTDYTGNEQYDITDITWDAKTKLLTYRLKSPSRVFIRIGLKDSGPLFATVTNWLPRPSGINTERWDGKDASNVLDLSGLPNLLIDAQAYTFSQNAILVGPAVTRPQFVKKYVAGETKRSVKYSHQKTIAAAYQESPEDRGDFIMTLTLPTSLLRTSDGVPVAKDIIPIVLDVPDLKRDLVSRTKMETVFYIDAQYIYESEVSYLPMTWRVDTSTLTEGVHYLTANLRGYEGNFGLATVKIFVKHDSAQNNIQATKSR